MIIINIHDAKTHLSQYIQKVSGGERIVIARAGKPVAILTPYHDTKEEKRQSGQLAGLLKMTPDFDAPLPKGIADVFLGKSA